MDTELQRRYNDLENAARRVAAELSDASVGMRGTLTGDAMRAWSNALLAACSNRSKPKPINGVEVRQVLSHLNDKTGRAFRWKNPAGQDTAHARQVRAILKKGYTVEDCKTVIDTKVAEWGSDDKMCKHLNPATPVPRQQL